MTDLPRHVRIVTKRRPGRPDVVYTLYQRHRNTSNAWPTIRLPDALTKEFFAAVKLLEEMEWRAGKFFMHGVEMPAVGDPAFWAAAEKTHRAALARRHGDAKDFTALVDAFKAHAAYQELAASTRRGYDHSADLIIAAWGAEVPADLTAIDAQQAIDALGDTPAAANQFRAFGSRLMAWGILRGFNSINPFQATEKIAGGEPWTPWPEWAFETLFAHAPFNVLMPCISALFTGQRQSDVLPMARPKRGDVEIEVTAQKTGTTVWVPIHSQYRPWIDKATELYEATNRLRIEAGRPAVISGALHLGVRGLPYRTTGGFRAEYQRLMRTEPFKRFRDERVVFHGLRKNAVNMLLEVGCTEAMVGSIVNMSEQMVRHYSRDVNVKRLAREGMKLLEASWSEVIPRTLEREQNANWQPTRRIGNRWDRGAKDGSS